MDEGGGGALSRYQKVVVISKKWKPGDLFEMDDLTGEKQISELAEIKSDLFYLLSVKSVLQARC